MGRILAALFLLAVPASAQVVELNGGASSLYGAEGASATFHFPQSTTTFGGGFANGHFRFGSSEGFGFHGWDITAGDSFLGFASSGAGLAVPARGFAATRRKLPICNRQPIPAARWSRPPIWGVIPCTPETKLTVFVGGTGPAFQNPFFSAASTTHFGMGLDYERHYQSGLTLSALTIFAGAQHTALGGFDWKGHSLKLSAGGGLLQSSPYWNAEADYQPSRHVGFEAAHSFYVFGPLSTSVDSLGAAGTFSIFNTHATYLFGRGYVYGVGLRAGWFSMNGEKLFSRVSATTFFSFGERLGRHVQISEYLSGRSPSLGIEYVSNRFSAGWSYQELLFPFGAQPFQRTLSAHISFRIRDAAVNLAALAPPIGKVLFSAGGTDYLQGPLQSPDSIRHAGSTGGRYVIQGRVLDSAGETVPGAAIGCDDQISYSNSVGQWECRLRRARPANVRLLPEEFSAPGEWEALTGSQRVLPLPEGKASSIELRVKRK